MRLTALRESPFAFASTYEAALRRSPESWRDQADSTAQGSDRSTFIAFSDDSPIGIAALYRTEEENDVGELLQMWVSPEYRGKGIARDLIDAVFQWASANGFRTVAATIAKGNVRALRFYQKYGFKPASEASLDGADDLVKGGRPCFLRCRVPVMPTRSVSDGTIAGFQQSERSGFGD